MREAKPEQPRRDPAIFIRLISFTVITFLGFLAVGVPLPVLSIYVKATLGFSTVIAGGVIGLQSLVTLLTRQYAGRICDARGAKLAALLGLGCASVAGGCYLVSYLAVPQPVAALVLLVVGRLVMGLGESLFITALSAWAIARVGPAHAGRVMAWAGIAMYAALALGAPLGIVIEQAGGFGAVAICTLLVPALGAALAVRLTPAPITRPPRVSFVRVLGAIWMPGLALTLASSGIGIITAFLTLRYQTEHWSHAGLALIGFGTSYILMRLLFGGLPDRLGGYRTAMASLAGEAVGQLVLWQATSATMAFIGASLTGLSYSLVFPSLGVEAIRRVPGENRGLVLGAYYACFDLGLAIAGPVAGIVIQLFDLSAAFLFAAGAAAAALVLAAISRARTPG